MKNQRQVRVKDRRNSRAKQAPRSPAEFKIVRLRECPVGNPELSTPSAVARFWRQHVATAPWFQPEKECLVVLLLNARRRLVGFEMVSQGTKDTLLVNTAEVFRLAVMKNASAIVVAHNHPSGDPSPSDADIQTTRKLIAAGQQLEIQVLDHLIIGTPSEASPSGMASLFQLGHMPGGGAARADVAPLETPIVPMPPSAPELTVRLCDDLYEATQRAAWLMHVDGELERMNLAGMNGDFGGMTEPRKSAVECGGIQVRSYIMRSLIEAQEAIGNLHTAQREAEQGRAAEQRQVAA